MEIEPHEPQTSPGAPRERPLLAATPPTDEPGSGATKPAGANAAPNTEVELKLEVKDSSWLSPGALAAALGSGVRLEWVRQAQITDSYCDSPAYDLLRAGIAFRVRRDGERVRIALKGLARPGFSDALTRRLEIESDVPSDAPVLDASAWPEAIREHIAGSLGYLPVVEPICAIHQTRDVFLVFDAATPHPPPGAAAPTVEGAPDGLPAAPEPPPPPHAVAEICLDRATVHAMAWTDADASRGTARRPAAGRAPHPETEPILHLSEIELELLPGGDTERFGEMASRLVAQRGLQTAGASKLERALVAIAARPAGAPAGTSGIRADMPMSEAGRLMWRTQLTAMILTEAGARRGEDIEYVHDMRVATRRARSVVGLFGTYFRPKAIRGHQSDLKRTGQALGTVRDLDVALLKLRKYAKSRPAEEQEGLLEIAAEWRVRRRDAYRALLAWLDGREYRRFVAQFDAFCQTAGAGARPVRGDGPEPEKQRVAHIMPSAILDRFEQVRAYDVLLDAGRPPAPIASLHALRIDCKRLRYSLEPVMHLLGPEGASLVTQLKALQDLLGDLNDASVAHDRLAAMRADGPPTAALEGYIAFQETTMAQLASEVPAAWRAFVSADNRRLLALAIAHL